MPEIARRTAARFGERFGRAPEVLAWAPGRINLIGEHTDYNDGLALPAAIDRWVAVALAPRSGDTALVRSEALDEERRLRLGESSAESGWSAYVAGALALAAERLGPVPGVEALFDGDVPRGAGLSSSAALSVAWLRALACLVERDLSGWPLVRAAQAVEHRYAGVACGLLDPAASELSRPGELLLLDFAAPSASHRPAPAGDVTWLVVHTGKERALADGRYGERVAECRRGLERARLKRPELRSVRELTLDLLDVSTPEGRRLRHVLNENERVLALATALERADFPAAGRLLVASHVSLQGDYEVSCPELDALVELGEGAPGWLGGRMMGGGFGGCTLHLVEAAQAEAAAEALLAGYRARFGALAPHAFRFALVGGAQALRAPEVP